MPIEVPTMLPQPGDKEELERLNESLFNGSVLLFFVWKAFNSEGIPIELTVTVFPEDEEFTDKLLENVRMYLCLMARNNVHHPVARIRTRIIKTWDDLNKQTDLTTKVAQGDTYPTWVELIWNTKPSTVKGQQKESTYEVDCSFVENKLPWNSNSTILGWLQLRSIFGLPDDELIDMFYDTLKGKTYDEIHQSGNFVMYLTRNAIHDLFYRLMTSTDRTLTLPQMRESCNTMYWEVSSELFVSVGFYSLDGKPSPTQIRVAQKLVRMAVLHQDNSFSFDEPEIDISEEDRQVIVKHVVDNEPQIKFMNGHDTCGFVKIW